MKGVVAAFGAGLLFAVGLAVGGMTQAEKIIGFLNVTGAWDPSLAFVMGGAVLGYAILARLIERRARPIFAGRFVIPTRRDIDTKLVAGAAVFGVGWGLGGVCPGPGLVMLPAGLTEAALFVVAMTAGMWLFKGYERLLPNDAPREQAKRDPSSTTSSQVALTDS